MSQTLQPAGTATQTVASGTVAVSAVAFGYYPQEGSRVVSAVYNWTAQTGFAEDLSQLVARGVETTIQSVFIDNSSNPQAVTLTANGTGQVLVCPGLSQAMFPLFLTGAPGFQLTVPATTAAVTRLSLLNCPCGSAGVWGTSTAVGTVVTTTPGQRVLVPLDIATVTTGGTAVAALAVGHKTAGGWIANPVTATVNLGINEIGTAAGTTSAGNTTFILPGQSYALTPSAGAVSVISSDSAHPFSGIGLQ